MPRRSPRHPRREGAQKRHRQVDPPAGGPDHPRLDSADRGAVDDGAYARKGRRMQAVSMSPKDAPSVAAMMRVGKDFQEFDSDSSAMIVLEGQQPLGPETHEFYDDMIAKLRADKEHVQHIQDFWGDPLTSAGAQSEDGKAATYRCIRREHGRSPRQRVGHRHSKAHFGIVAAAGCQGLRDRRACAAGRPRKRQQLQHQNHRVRDGGRHHLDAVVLLSLDIDGRARAGHTDIEPVSNPWRGGVPRLPQPDRLSTFATQLLVTLAIAATTTTRSLDQPLRRSPHCRRRPRVGVLHNVPRHRRRGARLGHDDRGATFSVYRSPDCRTFRRWASRSRSEWSSRCCCADSWAAIITVVSRFRLLEPKRAMRIGLGGVSVAPSSGGRAYLTFTILLALVGLLPCRATSRATTTASTFPPASRRTEHSQRLNDVFPSRG